MRITRIRCCTVNRRYDGKASNTRHAWHSKNYVLVELTTQSGLTGLGEMYCDGGGSPQVAQTMIEYEIAPYVIGRDPYQRGAIVQSLMDRLALSARGTAGSIAISAIDIALWDLLGRRGGLPCYQLLGGSSNKVSVYASGGMFGVGITPSTLAAEMKAAQSMGLLGAKIKAAAGTLMEDVERVAAVRDAIGSGSPLMVDAMFSPTVASAIELGKAMAPFNLHFLEAPTAMHDVVGWGKVACATGLSLAGPELSDDRDLMLRMLQADVVDYLQYDVAIAGGLTGGLQLAALAHTYRRKVTLHCAASAVAMAAAAHLGAAMGPSLCDGLEFHLMHDGLRNLLWAGGWRLSEGQLTAPASPGLGISLGSDELELLEAGVCCED